MSRLSPLLPAALLLLIAATSPVAGRADLVDAGGVDGDAGPGDRERTLPEDRRPTIDLAVDPTEAFIGEPVTWTAVVRRRSEDRVHLPAGADFGAFEIHDRSRATADLGGDWVEETLEVRLIAFETGELVIPRQTLTVVDTEGRLDRLIVAESSVTIGSLIAGEPEPDLRPDTGPGEPVLEEDYTLLWILGGLGAALLVALLTLLARWLLARRRPRRGPPPPPPRPPEEVALEKLEALGRTTMLEEGLHKEFHVLLSEALREYLGARYGFYAMESSTAEILAELERGRLERGSTLYARIAELLTGTDLVKFAKHVPSTNQSRELLDQVVGVVHATTPRPVAVEGDGKRGGPDA